MRARRIVTIVFTVFIFAAILYAGWGRPGPNSFEAAFQPGGKVVMDLSIGEFSVRGSDDNMVRVAVNPTDLPQVHSEVTVNGTRAKVKLEGPSNNFSAVIYVPRNSNIRATQTI